MATTNSQRIGIWVIAGMMIIGTIGGFIAMMVAPGNEAKDQAVIEAASKEYSAAYQEYQKKVAAQATELSKKYFATFSPYTSRVGEFDAASVNELKTEDLLVGDGEEIKEDTKFAAYYIGWNPSGKVFDQSIDGEALKAPIAIEGPASAAVIKGWQKGLIGMEIGGVRELTIPADLAYGETGQGEDIPANTPLKFVIMAIPQAEELSEPELPQVLKDYYRRQGLTV